jgi:tetratricopeptide (TPR) repeat protein
MHTRRSNASTMPTLAIAAALSIACMGCATVDKGSPEDVTVDRSAAGGRFERGNPSAPADGTVVAAADGSTGVSANDSTANAATPAASKTAATPTKSSSDSVSDTREKRLREIAADFDRRRDEAQYQAALNRCREDDSAGCREALSQLLARSPAHCGARLLLADVELSDGNPKGALDQARQVQVLEPQNAEAHHVMGVALDALGESAAALPEYEKATRLDSHNEQYAACYQAALDASLPPAAAQPEKSPTARRAADGFSPGVTSATTPSDRIDIADSASGAEQAGCVVQASATGVPEAACDDSPEAREALQRAVTALRNDKARNAADIAAAALRRHPRSAALARVLGAAQYRLGDYQAAQVAIAQALSLDKSDALAYFLMGSTLVRLGQTTAAERQFAEAARLDPRFSRHE